MSDISSDPIEQKEFEIYEKGFKAGVQYEQERIIELIQSKGEQNNEQ
jgi:hypothetical protein